MRSYTKREDVELAFNANVVRLRAEGRLILDRILNESLSEMSKQFHEGIGRGVTLEIGGSRSEMKRFLRDAAARHLALPPGKD